MNDTESQQGTRRGPYLLGRRLPDPEPYVGHIYEARHIESGAPALVLVPDPSQPWVPRLAWTVRSRSGVSPPFLATEAEHTPEASTQALHELTLEYIRLSGMLTCVEEREDTAAFLSQVPTPARRPPPSRRTLSMGMALVVGVALGALGVLALRPRISADPDTEVAQSVSGEPVKWVNSDEPAAPTIGYALPSKPFKGQHTPPCIERTETEINGGCWAQLSATAPCPRSTAEHEGRCYMPVRDPPHEPTSVQH